MPNRRTKKKEQEKMMWIMLGVGLVLAIILISL
jgi:hypothetical protein